MLKQSLVNVVNGTFESWCRQKTSFYAHVHVRRSKIEAVQIFLIAITMSIDAFSVALAIGCGYYSLNALLKVSFTFGAFQFLMPLLGVLVGIGLGSFIPKINYLAALVLFIIAFTMIKEAMKHKQECLEFANGLTIVPLISLAVATSIDAFAIGIPLSLMSTNVVLSSLVIGVVCLISSAIGMYSGRLCRDLIGGKMLIFGAVVLALIGVKMVIL